MANSFKLVTDTGVGTSAATVHTGAGSTETTIIGMSIANIHTSQITVDVAITNDGNTVQAYLIKDAPIPVGGALELIDGGSKIILQSGDKLRAKSSVTNSLDVVVSAVDTISE